MRVRHRIAFMGFVLFLVVDVALFIAVRQHVEGSQPAAQSDSVPSSSPGASAGTDDEVDPAARGQQSLVVSSTGIVSRVSRGRCMASSRPLIEISPDRGATFNEIALPLLDEVDDTTVGKPVATVRTIIMVNATSADEIALIGSDKQCRARQFVTKDGGGSWKQTDVGDLPASADGWYVDAAGTGVVSSGGASEPGCDVVALAPVSDRNVKVACSGGTILGSDDFGGLWVRLGLLDQVSGLTFQTLRDGFAVAPDDDCKARAYKTNDAGGVWQPLGCIDAKDSATTLVGSKDRLYTLVDGAVKISTDAGKTWSAPDDAESS